MVSSVHISNPPISIPFCLFVGWFVADQNSLLLILSGRPSDFLYGAMETAVFADESMQLLIGNALKEVPLSSPKLYESTDSILMLKIRLLLLFKLEHESIFRHSHRIQRPPVHEFQLLSVRDIWHYHRQPMSSHLLGGG
uniref:Uncharacterized protein n=1 Tax=Trichobilharzia regenti TaxID=157069 RepID=A0AA85JD07_TRIRE|nr:unnamed protein product [Trichobilharzia regenti]